MQRKRALFLWMLGSAAAMVIGAFSPWMKLFGHSSRGIDGINDGWLVVIAAVAGGAAFSWKRDRASAGVVIGCGCLGGAIAIYDRMLISDTARGTGGLIQVGWGVNLAIIASTSFAAAGLVWILKPEDANVSAASPIGGIAPVGAAMSPPPATEPMSAAAEPDTAEPPAVPNATDPTG